MDSCTQCSFATLAPYVSSHTNPAEAKASAAASGKSSALAQAVAASSLRCLYPECSPFFTPVDCCGAGNGASISAGKCGCVGG